MALFVYMTEQCRKDAERHAYADKLESWKQRIESDQRTTLFSNFPPPYLKKRFEKQIRLIAGERVFGEHVVVVFYRLFVRGDKEYLKLTADARAYGEQHLTPMVTDELLRTWLEGVSKKTAIAKQDPSEIEMSYLWEVMARTSEEGKDVFVLESPLWVARSKEKSVELRYIMIAKHLLTIVFDKEGLSEAQEEPIPQTDLVVVYRYFPALRRVFLAGLYRRGEREEARRIKQTYEHILESDAQDLAPEDVLKESSRAYLYELLFHEEKWAEAEKDEVANLALSPEESQILESAYRMEGFPLFINGRAGSGKSTILQYLYADYVRHYLDIGEASIKPLYLAFSEELIEKAIGNVQSLVGKQYSASHAATVPPPSRKAIEPLFSPYRKFLFGLLEPQERGEFPEERYVNYSAFKRLWHQKFAMDKHAGKYPPDLSWHVIRTFVKGYDADDSLEPSDYEQLSKDERVITLEQYQLIFERVWSSWYRGLREDGLWDDQDLIRHLFRHDRIQPRYTAIFADEVQDFTRIELEMLMRLSIFSDRKLSPQMLARVPFVFAGDPFQTLNPTGFRWSAVKSSFVVKFVQALDPARQSQMKDMNYHELSYNYRSTENIVKFSNLVQLLRSALFQQYEIKPQAVWMNEESSPRPVWFTTSDGQLADSLKNNSDITIILPCDEGEEVEFVRRDPLLSTIVRTDETGVPQNVVSAIRAKGLEFSRVVVYGFGKHATFSPLEELEGAVGASDRHDEHLTMEYYINKLYVAISRPKKRLYIVDTQQSIEDFWSFATKTDAADLLRSSMKRNGELWTGQLCQMQPGVFENWNEDQEDMLHIAQKYEREGKAKSDPFLLRAAALSYETLNDEYKTNETRAYALKLEQRYGEAGELYRKIGLSTYALECYWRGKQYDSILSLGEEAAETRRQLEYAVAEYVTGPKTPQLAHKITASILQKSDTSPELLTEANWHDAVRDIVASIAALVPSEESRELWPAIHRFVMDLAYRGVELEQQHLAKLHYQVGDYQQAIRSWERAGRMDTALYKEAKTATLAAQFAEGGLTGFTKTDLDLLHEHFLNEKNYRSCLTLCRQGEGMNRFKPLLLELAKQDHPLLREAAGAYLEAAVEKGQWKEISEFLQQRTMADVRRIRKLIDTDPSFIRSVYYTLYIALANSSLLPALSVKEKSGILQHVRPYLLSDGMLWSDVLPLEAAGAVLERLGRDVDCLQFYERVAESELFDGRQKRFAEERWLACKYRQADREIGEGKPKAADTARRHYEEAEAKRASLGLERADLPEYPALAAAESVLEEAKAERPEGGGRELAQVASAPAVAKEDKPAERPRARPDVKNAFEMQLDAFRLSYSRGKGRLIIEDGQMEIVSIRMKEKLCQSVDVEIEEIAPCRFLCEAWNLEAHFADAGTLTLTLGSLGLTLQLPCE
ncbi:hypothetical protein [Paenibacillus sp.]|uniref:hypothetical protein n=1 Tax=Paenibacillus sp. TaxID=58172 RepID=UPI002D279C7D|nr:hypothetical protein [Paenibacillus sp.]HZG57426.1 hypothetical protein [Paenibacillus sp.]